MPPEDDRHFVQRWKTLGPILEAEREEMIRETDTVRDVGVMELATRHAVQAHRPGPTSGLAELHRWLTPQPLADRDER